MLDRKDKSKKGIRRLVFAVNCRNVDVTLILAEIYLSTSTYSLFKKKMQIS